MLKLKPQYFGHLMRRVDSLEKTLMLGRVFSNESALCIWWPKYWSFSLSISPSNEYSVPYDGLVGSSCSLRESHESSPTPQLKSINSLALSFMVQLSHPYMTIGKTIALTRWAFVSKVMSLLFNMLSMLVIAFLPRSKRLLISWLQSPSAVILEPPKNSLSLFPLFLYLFTMK